MKRKRTIEPFDARTLRKFLEQRGGIEIVGLSTQHGRYRMPDGVEVPCPGKGNVTTLLTKDVARRLGMSYGELRAELGHPQIRRRAAAAKTNRTRNAGPASKAEVLRAIAELRAELTAIDAEVRPGVHDQAFYARRLQRLNAAKRSLGCTSSRTVGAAS